VDDFPEWETDDGLTGYYGTRAYLAPEALLGFSCQTAKIDSFSIGYVYFSIRLGG
jgi:serine/threonine protein kinase